MERSNTLRRRPPPPRNCPWKRETLAAFDDRQWHRCSPSSVDATASAVGNTDRNKLPALPETTTTTDDTASFLRQSNQRQKSFKHTKKSAKKWLFIKKGKKINYNTTTPLFVVHKLLDVQFPISGAFGFQSYSSVIYKGKNILKNYSSATLDITVYIYVHLHVNQKIVEYVDSVTSQEEDIQPKESYLIGNRIIMKYCISSSWITEQIINVHVGEF